MSDINLKFGFWGDIWILFLLFVVFVLPWILLFLGLILLIKFYKRWNTRKRIMVLTFVLLILSLLLLSVLKIFYYQGFIFGLLFNL